MKSGKMVLIAVMLLCCGILFATDTAPAGGRKTSPGGGGNVPADTKKAASGPADVRTVRWGMSRLDVRNAEKAAKLQSWGVSQLEFSDTILTQKARLLYFFDNDRLVSLVVLFTPAPGHESALHKGLAGALTDKYGKTSGRVVGRYGAALYTREEWVKKRTRIRLSSTPGQVRLEYSTTGLKQKVPEYVPGSADRGKL